MQMWTNIVQWNILIPRTVKAGKKSLVPYDAALWGEYRGARPCLLLFWHSLVLCFSESGEEEWVAASGVLAMRADYTTSVPLTFFSMKPLLPSVSRIQSDL